MAWCVWSRVRHGCLYKLAEEKDEKRLDKSGAMLYHIRVVRQRTRNAAIAQPVERILGKDEVASSNLASSSKRNSEVKASEFLFLLEAKLAASSISIRGRKVPTKHSFVGLCCQLKSG